MTKMKMPKGKMVSGEKFAAFDEKFQKKQTKKLRKGMKTPGLATELKLSQKEQGYSKIPRVKPQKKGK